jgi:hypothetical protein
MITKPVRIDAVVISTQHDDFVKPKSTARADRVPMMKCWLKLKRFSSILIRN